MQDFRKLLVWHKSHALAVAVHRHSLRWTKPEARGLAGQVRRAAESIPANIAEGCGREGNRELARFLRIAIGSATELDYHLQFAGETGIMTLSASKTACERAVEVRKMLIGLLKSVNAGIDPRAP